MATPIPFNANWYLSQNPDVAAAVEAGLIDAETHFQQFGRFEGRSASFLLDVEYYLANNPDVAEAVQAGTITAWDHAVQFGMTEGRVVTRVFDEAFYLQSNPDIAQAVASGQIQSGLQHFVLFGHTESRPVNPVLDLDRYLEANPDVAEAAAAGVIDPLAHLMVHGIAEGRSLGNGIQLPVFDNDPLFTGALSGSNHLDAWERVQMVAPFVPAFERPAGWTPPASTPIPVDFRAPEGSGLKLVVPSEVSVPQGVTLSDQVFLIGGQPTPAPAPAPAPAPVVPGGGGGGSSGSTPLPFEPQESALGSKTWTLPSANGNVGITQNGDNYVLTPANGAPLTIPANNLNTLVVPDGISLSGAADVLKSGPSITGAVTVNDVVSLDDVNTIAGKTNGVVTATLASGNLSSYSSLSGTGNAYTIAINDPADSAPLTASALQTLGGKTTGPVTVTNAVPISGTYADAVAALVTGVTGGTKILAPKSPITISDSSGTLTAANLRALGGSTSGEVRVDGNVNITGSAEDMKAALLASETKVIAGSAAISVTGADTLSVSDANAFAETTSGVVTATLEAGSLASFDTLTDTTPVANAYAITVNDPAEATLSATGLKALKAKTTGTVTVANAVTVSGSLDDLTGVLVTAATKVNVTPQGVTVDDAAGAVLTAEALSALGGAVSDTVTVAKAVKIIGSANQVTAALVNESTRVLAPTAEVTITDASGVLQATVLSAIGATTTGIVTVSNAVTLEGTASELKAALLTDASKVIATAAKVIIKGSGPASASDLEAIYAATSGDVTIEGTESADTYVYAGFSVGNRVLKISGKGGDDTITGGNANDVLSGCDGNDTVDGGVGNDQITGGNNNDTLYGGDGNDTVDGDAGDDYISGGAGSDTLRGGDGNDTITGGDGSDSITGGKGNDILTGSDGSDTFYYSTGDGRDTIADFVSGVDFYDTNWVNSSGNFSFADEVSPGELSFDTTSKGVFEVVSNFGNLDFTDIVAVMRAIDTTDKVISVTQNGNFMLILRNGSTGNSYLYEAFADSQYFFDPAALDPYEPYTGDTLTLVAVFNNVNLNTGDII